MTSSPLTPPPPSSPAFPPPRVRLLFTLHAFLSFVICNIDRINLSVAIIPMGARFGWSASTKGLVQGVFFAGYMTTQIAAGLLADARGGRLVLALAVTLWSISTFATPAAAHLTLPALLLMRVVLGAGEGAAMPAMNALIAATVPVDQRARSLSFIYSGMYAGSILGLLVAPGLIRTYSWESVFYLFGAIGLLWVVLFVVTTPPDRVARSPRTPADRGYRLVPVSSKERIGADYKTEGDHDSGERHSDQARCEDRGSDAIQYEEEGGSSHVQQSDSDVSQSDSLDHSRPKPTVWEMLSRRCVWAIIVAHFCCTWGYFVLLTWLPSFLHSNFELSVKTASFLSAVPWVAMFVFANIGGWIADFLISAGFSVTRTRKVMQSIGFVGPALFLGVMCRTESAIVATAYISTALAFASFSQSGVYSNHQDIGPNVAGTLLGISNTFASLPGLIGVYITGVVLDWSGQNWNIVYGIVIVFYAIGLVVFNLFGTSERQW